MAEVLNKISIKDEESDYLLEERANKLYDIIKNMNKNYIKEILRPKKENELSENQLKRANDLGKRKLFWIIIFLSIALFTFHLISIFVINGVIHSIQEELIASIRSYFTKKNRKSTDDFYQNFNKLKKMFPDYSLFYISSILSGYLSQCLGYILLTLFSLFINFFTLFFGFRKFKFNIERNKYKNYDLDEFIYLYILYLILCIFQGFIALYLLKIIQKGFEFYESFKEKIRVKKDLNPQESDTIMNVIENKNNQNNAEKINSIDIQDDNKILFFEGYFIFFIISLIFSVLIKIFLDQQFIGEYNYKSRKNANYYIIITYCSSTLISIFFIFYMKDFFLIMKKSRIK